jgi:hypothetical protein
MNNDQIIVTGNLVSHPAPGQPPATYSARIDGIACSGEGETEAQAIRSLANVLGDFVKGHASSIGHFRLRLRDMAKDMAGLADPEFQYGSEAPAIGYTNAVGEKA